MEKQGIIYMKTLGDVFLITVSKPPLEKAVLKGGSNHMSAGQLEAMDGPTS